MLSAIRHAAQRAAVAVVHRYEMARGVAVPVKSALHAAAANVHDRRRRWPATLFAFFAIAAATLVWALGAAANERIGHVRSNASAVGCQPSEALALRLRDVLRALAVLHKGCFTANLDLARQACVHLGIS